MKAKTRSYGFLTTKSNIVEVKATNARTAYNKAIKLHDSLKPKLKKHNIPFGKVTKSYVTYGRYGFAPIGIYKRLK